MRPHGIPFNYTKAYGVQSEISHVTVTRVAGQEVDFHRNVNTYHRDMMCKINSLCREQKRLKEYRRKLLKRKRKSSHFGKENNGHHSNTQQEHNEEPNREEDNVKQESGYVTEPNCEPYNNKEEPVLRESVDETHDLHSVHSEKLRINVETDENGNNEGVVLAEEVDEKANDQVVSVHHENKPVSSSYSGTSGEISLECSIRRSEKFISTPNVIPSIVSQRETGFIADATTSERQLFVSSGTGTCLRSEGKAPLRDYISTNLIKLQCTSNYKLLCRLVDTMAHRQNDKDIAGNKQKSSGSVPTTFKSSKTSFDQQTLKEPETENPYTKSDSFPCVCKAGGTGRRSDGVVPNCPHHSLHAGLQTGPDMKHVTREDMTGKRVLPQISAKATNSVRHDINRYLRSVSPVDPLLKRLSHFEKVHTVTWRTAFSSLKSLNCL